MPTDGNIPKALSSLEIHVNTLHKSFFFWFNRTKQISFVTTSMVSALLKVH